MLEVKATTTADADPGFFIFVEWYAMMEVKKAEALLNQ